MLGLSEEQRKQLLSYMWKRPYGEVASLIAMLVSLTHPNKKEENKAGVDILTKKEREPVRNGTRLRAPAEHQMREFCLLGVFLPPTILHVVVMRLP